MKRTISVLLLFAISFLMYAEDKPRVRLAYDLGFEMKFDNREYYESDFSSSMTIFGARLTPAVGLSLSEKCGAEHRLMFGVDVMKDFGASPVSELAAGGQTQETASRLNNLGLFREILLYYRYDKLIGKTALEIHAGIFPRKAMQEENYSQAFFSDSLRFYDNNLEGLLLKFHRPKADFEVGCDWMGQYGLARREKFMIFTSGEGRILPFMSIGYAGYMLHYANSHMARGLVDNILFNPYMRFDLGEKTGLQRLSFRLGWLQAMQRDREYDGVFVFPGGIEFDQEFRHWNAGVNNRLYCGTGLMPYYNNVDNAGLKYGSSLYLGDPFYRVHDDDSSGAGIYDRLEVFYEPSLGKFLKFRISALFHFHKAGYSGCSQMIGLSFDLNELWKRK